VGRLILDKLPYSLSIAVPAFLIAWVLAVFLGVFSATRHGGAADQAVGVGLFALYSIPSFVAATLLQRWLCIEWKLFPLDGFESPEAGQTLTTWEHLFDVLGHVTLPIVVYTYGALAYISRHARSGMLDVLRMDYVRTARAKGLPERTVVWRHAVRNGMMPIVTLLGTALPILLGGSVFIEYVFNIDGFGQLMIHSILQKDYNVVMGVQLITAVLTLVGLLLTDVLYAAMDPRISLK
jgi:peptide/nickel transport system permease protein